MFHRTDVQFIFQRYHITWEDPYAVEKKLVRSADACVGAKLSPVKERNTAERTELAKIKATKKLVEKENTESK